ncbi:hypothetical protein Ac2012v2_002479 [Leucoagaricus gongylophorus]
MEHICWAHFPLDGSCCCSGIFEQIGCQEICWCVALCHPGPVTFAGRIAFRSRVIERFNVREGKRLPSHDFYL